MENKIGISTGTVFPWDSSINNQIKILKKINPEAIELNFANISDLDETLTSENINYLKALNFISLHAPFFTKDREELYYENNLSTQEILNKLEKIYIILKAKAIVFHPNLIHDYSIFKNRNFNICLENMSIRRKIDNNSLKNLLDKNPNFQLTLDSAHALTWNKETLHQLISRHKEKISHVHFSDRRFNETKNKISSHQQLLFCTDIDKFKKLKELQCPIIIEVSIKDKINDIRNLKDEFLTTKSFFIRE
jgi:hypothetical protein